MIKEHIKKHKELYIGIGIGAGAIITWSIVRGQYSDLHRGSGLDLHRGSNFESDTVQVRPLSIFSKLTDSQNVVTTIVKEGRGPSGYRTRCLETLREFDTQQITAKTMDLSASALSSHLNKGIPDNVQGFHFERIPA